MEVTVAFWRQENVIWDMGQEPVSLLARARNRHNIGLAVPANMIAMVAGFTPARPTQVIPMHQALVLNSMSSDAVNVKVNPVGSGSKLLWGEFEIRGQGFTWSQSEADRLL